MDSILLIAGSIFVLVVLVSLLVFYYSDLIKKKKGIIERIRKEATPEQNESDHRVMAYLFRSVSRFGETLKPKNEKNVTKIRTRFLHAGFHGEDNLFIYYGAKAFLALLLTALAIVLKLAVLKTLPAQQFVSLIGCAALAGFYLPDYYIHLKIKQKKRKIFEGFPDALDLMVVCVEAGMGLDAAIKRVGDEMAIKNKELSDEFKLLSLELRAGKPRADALRNLAMRTDLEDVASLTTLLIQTDKFGTRVAQALRVHSDSMRTKRFLRAEEMAAKIPVKILFPLVFFILPALVVTLVAPGVIRFFRMMKGGVLG